MSETNAGYYQKKTAVFEIAASAQNTVAVFDFTFPFQCLVWKAMLLRDPMQSGDSITLTLRPNNSIGLLDSSPSSGQSSFVVDSSAASFVWPGTYLQFNDVSNEIIQIRSTSGVLVTTVTPLAFSHSSGTPLGLHIRLVDNYFLTGSIALDLGDKGSKGQMVNAGDVVRCSYTNKLGYSKTLVFEYETYTGPNS